MRLHSEGRLTALPENIRQGMKSFILPAQGLNRMGETEKETLFSFIFSFIFVFVVLDQTLMKKLKNICTKGKTRLSDALS
jgi:hypothetical protein